MERNDNSSLGSVQHGRRLISVFLVLFAVMLIGTPSFGQSERFEAKSDTAKNIIRYPIKTKFPAKVYHVYRLVKATKVKRVFADSAIQEYDRYCAYYFHILAPDNPVEGFYSVDVVIDSVEYKFEHDGTTQYFISRPEYMPKMTNDFIYNMTTMGIDFEMEYSPYGEVLSLGGGLRARTLEPFEKPNYMGNSYQKELWLRGLSDEHMTLYFDMVKETLPNKFVPIDTSWAVDFYTEADGIRFAGPGTMTFESFKNGDFTLYGTMDSLKTYDKLLISTGIDKQFPELIQAKAEGDFKLVIGPNGTIRNSEMNVNAVVDARIKKMEFRDYISTKYSWELFGKHMWR